MQPHVEAMGKSLVAVAWADGRMGDEEHQVLDGLIAAFGLADGDAGEIREYAKSARTLDDVPLGELSADDRRLLLHHAVIVTYVDGHQSDEEKALVEDLATRLHIPEKEAAQVISASTAHAEKLKDLL